jgi:hypothetical protein
MQLRERIEQQRVKHIVSSYQLAAGDDWETFNNALNDLFNVYPTPLIELALVEMLVNSWLTVPLIRGQKLLIQVHEKLQSWKDCTISSTITPAQFQQITGLDPTPIFGNSSGSSTNQVFVR